MGDEQESKYTILENNANAARAIVSAVQGTIGPKGLDTMLVDQFGDVVITNDGITILSMMEVNHPVAKMMINAVRAQQEEVGDGTTTTTLMAGEMLVHGLEQVSKGVPVAQVIQGLRKGVINACQLMEAKSIDISRLTKEDLYKIALVAGREYEDIAQLIVDGVEIIGKDKLLEPSFKLAEVVKAVEGAENQVFLGVLINKERLNKQMPLQFDQNVKVLIIDDALEPEEFDDEALTTESGFKKYLELRSEFKANVEKIVEAGVQVVLVDRGVDDAAEEILTDAGVMVVSRVPNKELRAVAEHTGARMIKRTGLKKSLSDLEHHFGFADQIICDEKLKHVKVLGGRGKAIATILVSATTSEIVGERERIAKDAASSVQVAVKSGLVAGGGASELAVARELEEVKNNVCGMATFGVDCVIQALRRPFLQIISNAGFNPLEKLGDVNKAQVLHNSATMGIDCDTGLVTDLLERGVVDPTMVKVYAIKVAGEVAEAILRINTIIRKKEVRASQG